jgi:UDP-N-acetylglucosamine--N-acetylmuramyl-(pentapeptide) pyrophosphoryl-undecaprenol N-acetylglucosamine transferase
VLWFGAGRGVEERVFADRPAALAGASLRRVALALEPPGGGAPTLARLGLRPPGAFFSARRALAAHRSAVLLGLGGFTTLPAVLAARSLRIPVALLEINAATGRATALLARCAARVLHAWPSTLPGAPSERHRHVGPPLAPEFLAPPADDAERRTRRAELAFDPARPLLAVLGGSQGALALNAFVRRALPALSAAGLQVLHQVGPGRAGEAASPAPGYRAVEYVADVRALLDAATLVLCRGGASTLAEVAARATPALVVPYPHHRDRHQERNACALGSGVRIVPEEELGIHLEGALVRLAGTDGTEERARMRAALVAVVPRDGAARIAEELRSLAASTRVETPP